MKLLIERKKQPVRVIHENSSKPKEAAPQVFPEKKKMFLKFTTLRNRKKIEIYQWPTACNITKNGTPS